MPVDEIKTYMEKIRSASRVKNSVKNARIAMFFMAVTLLLTFFSRKIFIESLGTDLVGLTATIQNILGFLNIAELGIVSAVAATLYKPLYENDRKSIDDIISIFGYLYRIIGFCIIIGGCIVACFLGVIFKDAGVSLRDVYFGYAVFLLTSLVGYFISYRQTLLDADQRQYVIVVWTNLAQIGKLVLQICLLKFFHGTYVGWLFVELFFGIIYGFWINRRVNRLYPWLQTSYRKGKAERKRYGNLFRTIKNVIPHKLGSFVLNQTGSVLVYAFANLSMVTVFTNYTLILNKAVLLISTAFNGVGGSIGHLVAEGNRNKIMQVFWELQFFFFYLAGVAVICFFYLVEPFIFLWLGNGFLLEKSAFYLLLLNTFIGIIRVPIGLYINGYVLFQDIWAPIGEAVINLSVAIVCGYYFGITGVLAGASVSLIIMAVIWKPYFLYRAAFHERIRNYWSGFAGYLAILAITWLVVYLCKPFVLVAFSDWGKWLQNAAVLFMLTVIVYGAVGCIWGRGSRTFGLRLKSIVGL